MIPIRLAIKHHWEMQPTLWYAGSEQLDQGQIALSSEEFFHKIKDWSGPFLNWCY
ncbi:hypothetical protein IV102_25515 [bacterium]|nr:hypothetical protein [bacterium]